MAKKDVLEIGWIMAFCFLGATWLGSAAASTPTSRPVERVGGIANTAQNFFAIWTLVLTGFGLLVAKLVEAIQSIRSLNPNSVRGKLNAALADLEEERLLRKKQKDDFAQGLDSKDDTIKSLAENVRNLSANMELIRQSNESLHTTVERQLEMIKRHDDKNRDDLRGMRDS